MSATIDKKNSKCFKIEDWDKLFEPDERDVGFDGIGMMVFE